MPAPLFSGTLFRQIVEELEASVGRDEVWKAVGSLSDEQRAECLDNLGLRWIHASTSVALFRALAPRIGRSARELHNQVIERTAQRVFTTIWRVIFHFLDVESLVARIPMIVRRSYQGVRVEATMTGSHEATIRLRDWPDLDELTFEGLAISLRVAFRNVAKQDVTIERYRADGGARYVIVCKS